MTDAELLAHCNAHGVPYRMVGERVLVLDMTLFPGAMRELFTERGMLKSSEPVAEPPSDEPVAAVTENATPPPAPKKKGGKK